MEVYYIVAALLVGSAVLFLAFSQTKQFRLIRDELKDELLRISTENQKQIEKNSELFEKLNQTTLKLNDTLKEELYTKFRDINSTIEAENFKNRDELKNFMETVNDKLMQLSDRVDQRLKSGFDNVDKTFRDIVEGIARISEAQRKIEELSKDVVSLQEILDDKKKRGVFGEVRLETILKSVFGQEGELYQTQYSFENSGKRVMADAVIKAPEMGLLAVDSKFPLENYVKMIEAEETDKARFTSQFKQNLKKHIDDIADKYICPPTTADMAVMFLPSEAIFAEVNAHHADIIAYARQKKIWIASPTTLMALLATVQAVVKDVKTRQQALKIQQELARLSKNFERYKERWEKLIKDIDRLSRDAKDVHITTQKISDDFKRIERVEFESSEALE
ncbi:DNA recombination protein RmuC [Hippea maritima]|uniref:RmuC-domain protein n=1 Tax=Hippea maritima (strain ATCC 700847 / DSM 10411 / MH2) TaxID=760142 RepID=F2LX10_HIPMA|nr:DNA recombination protein RmuC [Hippea maritima]AEA34194.1 RmuC-domain protein [Hippea maritima DSM 10411]